MLYQVNATGTIDPRIEMHYRFHQKIDPSQYPQVHDFYEIMLVTDGKMEMEINHETELAGTGALFLIRPGDVHNRKAVGACSYINLAFPAEVVEKMFRYLNIPEMKQRILGLPRPPRTKLTAGETLLLKARLEKLNLLPLKQPHVICMELRRLMLDVMLQYFLPAFSSPVHMSCPGWLEKLAEKLEHPDYFSCSLEELASMSGCSREHLCRSFKKYLGVSPSAYLNAKRLNYAANLLLHSDQKVIDVAYASGFQSLSRFYHAFKKEFGVSPLQYRKQ